MVNVIRGKINNSRLSEKLVNFFDNNEQIKGNLFLGYPITSDEEIIDALLVSPQYGIVAIIFYNDLKDKNFSYPQSIYSALLSRVLKEKELFERKDILINLEIIIYAPTLLEVHSKEEDDCIVCVNDRDLLDYFNNIKEDYSSYYKYALRCVQFISNLKKISPRKDVKKQGTKGWILKNLNKSIANLDNIQMAAAMEISENVQRIRGLAGSGKTIVLALKAAYIHITHPDWKIAVTFYTRSLKQQFTELISRFVWEYDLEPNWDNLKIIHAWGSYGSEGIYYNICKEHNIEYLNLDSAKAKTVSSEAFNYVCKKAIRSIQNFSTMYDVILIDEAQDLPTPFLQLCYKILPKQKRLIYAYDELQNLTSGFSFMDTPENIFGSNKNKIPNVILKNEKNKPQEDIILNVCYRNSRPILSSAHALGFRLYGEIIQMFDKHQLWTEIGYEVEAGELKDNCRVVLKRTSESSPLFLEEHSPIDDLIIFKAVDNEVEQAEWVAKEIKKNLECDELDYKDILVIHTDPVTTSEKMKIIINKLQDYGINSHLAGVTTSRDDFFMDSSITFTSIYRAKGNEAAMVYVVDGQNSERGNISRSRNILFTAMTRSKAWLRVVGYGDAMKDLCNEFQKIKDNDFKLEFIYPNEKQREHLRIINRDKSVSQEKKIDNTINALKMLIANAEDKSVYKDDIPKDLLDKFISLYNK